MAEERPIQPAHKIIVDKCRF